MRRGRERTRLSHGRMTPRPRRRPSPAPRRAAAGRLPLTPPSAQRRTCRALHHPSRGCVTTLGAAAGATRPPPPATAATCSPPGTGRDRPRTSSAPGQRSQAAARQGGGIAPVETTFHEATGDDDDDVDYGANNIRRSSSPLYPSMCSTGRSNIHRRTHPFGRRQHESSLWGTLPET